MRKEPITTFALAAAALFLGGCGKQQPSTTAPGSGAGTPAAADGSADAAGDVAAEGDAADEAEVKCLGINECSGQGACDVAGSHECGGQNSCKGKGWILAPASECERKGGKVL